MDGPDFLPRCGRPRRERFKQVHRSAPGPKRTGPGLHRPDALSDCEPSYFSARSAQEPSADRRSHDRPDGRVPCAARRTQSSCRQEIQRARSTSHASKLITLLLAVASSILLNSCSAARYVTVDNQVYALPGDKVIIEIATEVESLTGTWSSYYEEGLSGGSVQTSDEPLQLTLRELGSSNEIAATKTDRRYFPDSLPKAMQIVVIPVEITVPANASVPSTWSGFLTGRIRVAVPLSSAAKNESYIKTIARVNVAVTLHVTTQEDVNAHRR